MLISSAGVKSSFPSTWSLLWSWFRLADAATYLPLCNKGFKHTSHSEVASSHWSRSAGVRQLYVEHVDTATQAEMKYVCSTSIRLSFPDWAKLGLAQIIPLKEHLVYLYLWLCVFSLGSTSCYVHIPLIRKSVTKWPHLGVNELDQGRHARPRSRKQSHPNGENETHIPLFMSTPFAPQSSQQQYPQCCRCVLLQ